MRSTMKFAALVALAASAAAAHAQSTSCLVLGERTARVATPQGERSPVFVATACDSLKLVSGTAQASWIGRDGKPRVVPITAQGVSAAPQAGSEERSVNVVWGELTTRREKQQPAYMRSFGVERPPRVYLPVGGLTVVEKSDGQAQLKVTELSDGNGVASSDAVIPAGQPVRLDRALTTPGNGYVIQIRRGDLIEEFRWTVLPAEESARVDERLAEIDAAVADPAQRQMMQAMLFEQLKLRVNMDLVLQQIRAGQATEEPGLARQ